MSRHDDGQVGRPVRRNIHLRHTGSISSLNEAWLHTVDTCVSDGPMNEVILPLMRNCFFGGAMHAVSLLQSGHGEQLASDISRFIKEEPQS
jgi:hypothetical protein